MDEYIRMMAEEPATWRILMGLWAYEAAGIDMEAPHNPRHAKKGRR